MTDRIGIVIYFHLLPFKYVRSITPTVMPLLTDQEVLGSMPRPSVGCFSSRELFHFIYGLGFPVFQCPVHIFSLLSLGRPLNSVDHRSWDDLQLRPYSYM